MGQVLNKVYLLLLSGRQAGFLLVREIVQKTRSVRVLIDILLKGVNWKIRKMQTEEYKRVGETILFYTFQSANLNRI